MFERCNIALLFVRGKRVVAPRPLNYIFLFIFHKARVTFGSPSSCLIFYRLLFYLPDFVGLEQFVEVVVLLCAFDLFNLGMHCIVVCYSLYITYYT